jgi:hypothetical protein
MCAVTKHGGLFEWSRRLGLPRKDDSDSDFGWLGEEAVAADLRREGHLVERSQKIKAPYDLLVDGCVRIDVKTANHAAYAGSTGVCAGWFYRIAKIPSCDLVALHQADAGGIYFIPWEVCPRTNITITKDGKYSAYLNRFDIVRAYVESAKALRSNLSPRHNAEVNS